MELKNKLTDKHEELYGGTPDIIVQSPGRINLIGEHTDYNEGFVLPAAVDKNIVFSLSLKKEVNNNRVTAYSLDFEESFDFHLDNIKPLESGWQNYIMGVVAELQKAGGEIQGFDLIFSGNVPRGSGLSSSAALECGLGYGLNEMFELGFSREKLAGICQMAEHNYAGVKCGIMDQFASLNGKKDAVFRLDCRSLDYEYFPLELGEYKIVLCNTNVSHNLASSEYNTRRAQCEEGVEIIQKHFPHVKSLRDASLHMINELKNELSPVVYNRCKYVIEENIRVEMVCKALEDKDFQLVGSILYKAHEGMRTEYEVSCKELDFLVDFTKDKPYVLGSRLMGGGFGGCTINLVKSDMIDQFIKESEGAYMEEMGLKMSSYVVTTADGSEVVAKTEKITQS